MESTEEAEMGFFDHIEVLRGHIIRSVAAIALIAILALANGSFVFDKLLFAPSQADFITYKAMCKISRALGMEKGLCITELNFRFMNTELFGQIMTQIQTAFVLGLVFAFPYIIFEVWRFIKPALRPEELDKTNKVIIFSSLFFLTGVVFGYLVIVPFSVNFSYSYAVSELIDNRITLRNYIDFVTMILLGCGLLFELPMIAYLLSKLGILGPSIMRKYRRHAIVVILIIAAFITPSPDVFTQLLVAIPVFFLYELSIIVSARIEKQRQRESAVV